MEDTGSSVRAHFMVEVSVSRGTRRTYDLPLNTPFSCCLRALEHSDRSWFSLEKAWLEWAGPVPCIPPGCVLPVGLLVSNPDRCSEGAGPGCCSWPVSVPKAGPVRLGEWVGSIKVLRNHQETPASLLSLFSTCSLPQSVLVTKN